MDLSPIWLGKAGKWPFQGQNVDYNLDDFPGSVKQKEFSIGVSGSQRF